MSVRVFENEKASVAKTSNLFNSFPFEMVLRRGCFGSQARLRLGL